MRAAPSTLKWLLLLGAILLLADEAHGRVGGGETFGSGRRGGGGGGDFGGGGGGEAEILFLLLRLAIHYPAIGVPLLLLFIAFLVGRGLAARGPAVERYGHRTRSRREPSRPRAAPDRLGPIRSRDPGFSRPVLQDFLQLVHRRATEAAVRQDWAPLLPFVGPEARRQLQDLHRDVDRVAEVVVGSAEVTGVSVTQRWTEIRVRFVDTRVETRGGREQRVLVEEEWTFRRAADAASLPPEDTLRMGCPSCGAAVETDDLGRCRHCETAITAGQLQWQASKVRFLSPRRPVTPPETRATPGGAEPGYHAPTVIQPDLAAQLRAFRGRHPDFSPSSFAQRVKDLFATLQSAWSDGAWDRARPHVTDALFQTLRFWMDRYTKSGLRNRLDGIRTERVEIVKVELDAWYESVTVRIWGAGRDYVVDEEGRVVGGNADVDRRFSEYWTFLRAAGTGAGTRDATRCPSCGAPLDRISQAGVCGYCDTKITTGRFDWVLSRIEQAEVYRG